MILIDTSDRKKWEGIENRHKKWFYDYWTENKLQEEINSLEIKEKTFIYELFDESNVNNDISEEKIKNFITKRNLEKYKNKKDTFNKLIDKSDINDTISKNIKSSRSDLITKKCKKFWPDLTDEIKKLTIEADRKQKYIDKLQKKESLMNKQGIPEEVKEIVKKYEEKLKTDKLNEKELNNIYDNLKKQLEQYKDLNSSVFDLLEENKKSKSEDLLDIKKITFKEGFEEIIKKIFNYEKYEIRHSTIADMNVPTCPYCGRQYTTNYSNNEKTTADLDHYYPQSNYPYLALSLYNFIPSCLYCNRIKGNKEGHIYPYDEEFGDKAIFKTSKESVNGILNSNKDDFAIIIDVKDNSNNCINKSKEIFNLAEVYKTSHNQYILDMLHTIEHYPDSYLETVNELFDENLTKTIKKKEEEFKSVTGKKEKDKIENELNKLKNRKAQEKKSLKEILRKPYQDRIERNDTLAKLTKDILTEYDSL